MKKNKILILAATFPPRGKGGGPAASLYIAKGLKDAGFEISIVTVGDDYADEHFDGLDVTVIKSPNIYWDYLHHSYPAWKKIIWHLLENFNPIAYFSIRKILKEKKPDIVVTISIENINVAAWLSAKHLGLPIVHFVQSYFLCCWKGSLFKNCKNCSKQCFDCKLMSFGKKVISKHVNAVVGETDFILEKHKNFGYFNNIKSKKIPGPIDEITISQVKQKSGQLIVGYMGVLESHKGLDVLAEAAAMIGSHENIHFMVAGTSRSEEYKAQLKTKFGNASVDFLGWVVADETYPKFDVLVVPSLWNEPFGRIVVEAMAYGIPIIASKSGGLQENVKDGVNGFLYDPNDALRLAELIKKLSADELLRLKLAENSRKLSREFNYKNFVNNLGLFILNELKFIRK